MNSAHQHPDMQPDVRLEESTLSRRSFLLIGGAIAATAYTVSAEEPERNQPQKLSAEQRQELLTTIESIIKPEEDRDSRVAQVDKLTPLIASYRASITNAPDVTLSEVIRAIEINRIKINMPHYSDGIGVSQAAPFLTNSSVWFYDDLFKQLTALQTRFPDEEKVITRQMDLIRSDLLWSQAHGLDEIDRSVGAVIAERFINPAEKNLRALDPILHYSTERPLFHLTLLTHRFDTIAEALDREITSVISETAPNPRHSVARILDIATSVKEWIPYGIKAEAITSSEQTIWNERIAHHVEKPIFSHLVSLYLAAETAPIKQREKHATTFWGMPFMLVGPPDRPLIQRISSFLENLNGCRVELGNEFVSSYNTARQSSGQYPEKVLGLVSVLAHLSPDPSLKRGIVDDLRLIFRLDMARHTSPQTIASMLEILLFSDHTYAASEKNRTMASASTVQACLHVLDTDGTIDNLGHSATDAQKFALELTQLCATTVGLEQVSFIQNESNDRRNALCKVAEEIIGHLVSDLYTLSQHITHADGDLKITTVHLPVHWSGRDLIFTEQSRANELSSSMHDLTTFTDGIVKRLASFDLATKNEAQILERLIFVTQLLDCRDGLNVGSFGHHANPYMEIEDRFPYLSTNAARPSAHQGPFVDVYLKARNILYQRAHGKIAPPLPDEDGLSKKPFTDKDLDLLALSYAKTAEKKFICSFILRLWNSDGRKDQRPIPVHRVMSENRMTQSVSRLLHGYGMLEKYDDINKALTGDSDRAVEMIQAIRLETSAEQRRLLGEITVTGKTRK